LDDSHVEAAPASSTALLRALRSGERPLLEHVESVLDAVETREPRLRALVPEPRRRERLLADARALLERFPDAGARPSIFGALVGVKDIFAVDGLPTRCGSALPPEAFEAKEATCVGRLRAAGALVLGKTVTTEFAFAAPGATTNPHAPDHTPGGSSSGSAAAVACGYAPIALGSQTVGSVIRPAAFCGVVGFKPSYERIPRDGVLLFSEAVDCVGLLAAEVEAAALAASVMLDTWEPVAPEEGRMPTLGVPEGPYLDRVDDDARCAFESQIAALEERGFEVRRLVALESIDEITRRHLELIAAEFARAHAERFARWGALYSGQSAALYDWGVALGDAAIAEGRQSSRRVRAALEARMDGDRLDAWATPAAPGAAPFGLHQTGDTAMNLVWTHAHMPAVTLPAGRAPSGLPLGLQLCARVGQDERLLAWARSCEGALPDAPRPTG
jgi:Asp-tRNA(Asn)/Glu-tRNA(Gln) amidotransferase A subunit family amidase